MLRVFATSLPVFVAGFTYMPAVTATVTDQSPSTAQENEEGSSFLTEALALSSTPQEQDETSAWATKEFKNNVGMKYLQSLLEDACEPDKFENNVDKAKLQKINEQYRLDVAKMKEDYEQKKLDVEKGDATFEKDLDKKKEEAQKNLVTYLETVAKCAAKSPRFEKWNEDVRETDNRKKSVKQQETNSRRQKKQIKLIEAFTKRADTFISKKERNTNFSTDMCALKREVLLVVEKDLKDAEVEKKELKRTTCSNGEVREYESQSDPEKAFKQCEGYALRFNKDKQAALAKVVQEYGTKTELKFEDCQNMVKMYQSDKKGPSGAGSLSCVCLVFGIIIAILLVVVIIVMAMRTSGNQDEEEE